MFDPRRPRRTPVAFSFASFALTLFILSLATTGAHAQVGLDPTFGFDGRVLTNVSPVREAPADYARALAIQPDGKVIAAGFTKADGTSSLSFSFALVRYESNGAVDMTFGTEGKVVTDILSNDYDAAYAVAVQPDGKIVAVGTAKGNYFAVVRYNPNGSLDTTFDGDGIALVDFGRLIDEAQAVAIQRDGRIVIAGIAASSENDERPTFAVARLTQGGALDNSFDGDGKQTVDFGSNLSQANSLVIQPDGRIVLAGSSGTAFSTFAVARLTATGALDNSFDGDGKLTTAFNTRPGDLSIAYAARLQPDGRIVVAGTASTNDTTGSDFAIARYNTDGSLDTSFDGDGKVTTSTLNERSGDVAEDLFVQPDGKIVLAGHSRNSNPIDFVLMRYRADGSLDPTFGANGIFTIDFPRDTVAEDDAYAVLLQPDGKILVAGESDNKDPKGREFAVARLLGGSSTVQFSAAEQNVNEASGAFNVTVTRTGNLSEAVTVEYLTGGLQALFNCNPTVDPNHPNDATARCDYSTTVGTLRFNSGQAVAYIAIPIINDVHVESSERFSVALRNPVGATLGEMRKATITITDNDQAGQPNPISDNRFFVRQHYYDFLGRIPAPDEIEGWVKVIEPDCGVNGACYDRMWVSGQGFFFSPEFQAKGYYVYRFYKLLGRNRLPTYDEFIPDMVSMAGTTDADKNDFARRFSMRDAYLASYDGITNEEFAALIVSRTGLTTINAAQIATDLNNGTKTRAQILRETVESREMTAREFNEAWVVMQYFGYLRRDGAASEYAGWLQVLNQNPNNWRTMINGFMNSIEYRNRFGQP